MSDLIFTSERDPTSLSVGKQQGFYLPSTKNIYIGYGCGFNTKTSNNLLIGHDLNSKKGNTIRIGDNTHKDVIIGPVDIMKLIKQIDKMNKRIEELETHVRYMPEGEGYNEAKKDYERLNGFKKYE